MDRVMCHHLIAGILMRCARDTTCWVGTDALGAARVRQGTLAIVIGSVEGRVLGGDTYACSLMTLLTPEGIVHEPFIGPSDRVSGWDRIG